jgi:hypothetical protein
MNSRIILLACATAYAVRAQAPAAAPPPVPAAASAYASTLAGPATRFVPQMAVKGAPSYATLPRRTRRYVITEYGAVGDAKTVNTKAIQAAIDKCSATKAGGVVVVPKGTFLSGAIFLKQGVNLLVEKDGVLKGTTNPDDYPQIKSRWEGTEEEYTASFVNAEGVTGLEISGEGTIDGSGEEWVQRNPQGVPQASAALPAAPADSPAAAPGARTAPAPLGAAARTAAADRDSELERGAHRRALSAQPGGVVPVCALQPGRGD